MLQAFISYKRYTVLSVVCVNVTDYIEVCQCRTRELRNLIVVKLSRLRLSFTKKNDTNNALIGFITLNSFF